MPPPSKTAGAVRGCAVPTLSALHVDHLWHTRVHDWCSAPTAWADPAAIEAKEGPSNASVAEAGERRMTRADRLREELKARKRELLVRSSTAASAADHCSAC